MSTKLKDIRAAVADMLKTVKIANGYSADLKDSEVYSAFDAKALNDRVAPKYPKAFVVTDNGKMTDGVSGTKDTTYDFLVVVVLRASATEKAEELANRIDDMQADIEKLFDRNRNLGGLVHEARVDEFTTDSGFCFPEAIVVASVSVEKKSEFAEV